MKHEQYEKIYGIITKEIAEFKQLMIKQSSEYVYDRYYEISAYEELYNYITNYGEGLIYEGFPKKDILDYFYYQFMKTDYELVPDDLSEFFYNSTLDYMRYKKKDENEM